MHVGGVRIEDDILIIKYGYENLTTTPKSKEMLDIIQDGAKCHHGIECRFNLDGVRRSHKEEKQKRKKERKKERKKVRESEQTGR